MSRIPPGFVAFASAAAHHAARPRSSGVSTVPALHSPHARAHDSRMKPGFALHSPIFAHWPQ